MAKCRKRYSSAILPVLIGVLLTCACAPAPVKKPKLYNAEVVTIREGDTLRSLAEAYLSDPAKSYVISDFNSRDNVLAGQKIVIPLIPLQRGGLKTYGYQTVTVLRYKKFSRNRSGPSVLTPAVFESQLAFLERNGYHVVTVDQLLDFLEFKDQLPQKSVVITIDDSSDTALDIAYPLLKKYGVSATLFIQTDLIGKKNALTWPELRYLSQQGFEIHCRSATFRNPKDLRIKRIFNQYIRDLDRELSRAKSVIQHELGQDCKYLAYPEGPTHPIIVVFAEKHGFRAGFMPKGESNPFFVSNNRIGRSTVSGDGDLKKFSQQLMVYENMELK
jgi:hypothetical protein